MCLSCQNKEGGSGGDLSFSASVIKSESIIIPHEAILMILSVYLYQIACYFNVNGSVCTSSLLGPTITLNSPGSHTNFKSEL